MASQRAISNKAVSRNLDRFPEDFAFYLTTEEARHLMFQSGTSSAAPRGGKAVAPASRTHGGVRKPPRVFTEQGVAMLASVLRSARAVSVSVAIVRAFVRLRDLLAGNHALAAKVAELDRKLATHDGAIRELFDAIRQLLAPPTPAESREMGFHTRLLPTPSRPTEEPGRSGSARR